MSKKVIVIGSGVAGLASAIRLQAAGYQVEIYEKGLTPGGKMNRIELDGGYKFDLGPSIVMMPEIYRELFEVCGRDPDDYIPMEKLDPIYRAYFSDIPDEPFDISSDMTKLTKTIEAISEEDTAGFFGICMKFIKNSSLLKIIFFPDLSVKGVTFITSQC